MRFYLDKILQGRRTVQNFGVAATNATPKYWGGRWGGRNKGTQKYWGGRGHPGHPSSAGPAVTSVYSFENQYFTIKSAKCQVYITVC